MPAEIKLAVVGNCQARPIADLVARLSPRVRIHGIVITHLARNADEPGHTAMLGQADLIFAQAVQETYPTTFVRTSQLREGFGDRLITWPNLFFKGQCPDLVYVTKTTGERVVGPLGEYQNLTLFEAWRAGVSIAEAERRLTEGDSTLDCLPAIAEASLKELRDREAHLDVAISDTVSKGWRDERQFFTFNHPAKHLLASVARDLLARVDIPIERSVDIDRLPEPLDRIVPAVLRPVTERLGLRLPLNPVTKGCAVDMSGAVRVVPGVRQYSVETLAECTFSCLDRQLAPDTAVRIT